MWYADIGVPIDGLRHVGRFANDSKQLAHTHLPSKRRTLCMPSKPPSLPSSSSNEQKRKKNCVRNPNANFLLLSIARLKSFRCLRVVCVCVFAASLNHFGFYRFDAFELHSFQYFYFIRARKESPRERAAWSEVEAWVRRKRWMLPLCVLSLSLILFSLSHWIRAHK